MLFCIYEDYYIPDPVWPQPDMWHSWYDEYGVTLFGRHAAVTLSLNVIPVPLYGIMFTNAMSKSFVESESTKSTEFDGWSVMDNDWSEIKIINLR